jgi:hypothetical protein
MHRQMSHSGGQITSQMAESCGRKMGRYPDLALRRKPQQAQTMKKEPKFHKNKVSLSPLRTKLDCQLCPLSVRVLYRLRYAV